MRVLITMEVGLQIEGPRIKHIRDMAMDMEVKTRLQELGHTTGSDCYI